MQNGPRPDAPFQTMEKLMPKEFGFINRALLVAELLMGVLCLPVELLLRRSFGQRYVTPVSLFLLTGTTLLLTQVEVSQARGTPAKLLALFSPLKLVLWVCIGLCVKHLYDIWKSCRSGEHIHTRYSGTPYAFWWRVAAPLARVTTVDEFLVKRVAEPLGVLLAGLVVLALDRQLGLFLLLSGAMLAVKNQLEYARLRSHILDMMDGIVEGQALRRVVQPRKQANQGTGFALPAPVNARPVLMAAVLAPSASDAFGGLAKELKDLMGEDRPETEQAEEPKKRATCPHCGKSGNVPASAEGRKVRCTGCRKLFSTQAKEEVTSE